ncbi:hypothetical protein [Burkholderia gladioli]|uniref:hypothetical protein n=1 Tax=Burkholderia gladioli TaxID=28095 RepID=UPI00163E435B|nr:hypothetical protein [Burkholderia gladioli]
MLSLFGERFFEYRNFCSLSLRFRSTRKPYNELIGVQVKTQHRPRWAAEKDERQLAPQHTIISRRPRDYVEAHPSPHFALTLAAFFAGFVLLVP